LQVRSFILLLEGIKTTKGMYRYVFYTQETVDGYRRIHAIKHCKRPKATKVYKHLEYLFNSGEVAVYGYGIESNI